jgi:hypothetical protein
MQTQDIEILNTLEALAAVHAMLRFHREQSEPSINSIENYVSLKANLLTQLNELLDELALEVRVEDNPKSYSKVS